MAEHLTRLSERKRLFVLFLATVAIIVIVNSQIVIKEDIMENGETLLLRLAPRDPRSLLQGDYMALRYAMADQVSHAARTAKATDGHIVVVLSEMSEASFVDLFEGQALAENQRLLRFRRRGESVRLASDAYFFEEGEWETYAAARFGELRVSEGGDAVLVGLRDREGNPMGALLH
jgi:uncharacterized membrane-anchored protein